MPQIRILPEHELCLIKPLFLRVFDVELPDGMMAWKYGGGHGRSYAMFSENGELLVHCGVFFRMVLADGTLQRISQLGDLMAQPGRHGGLVRSGSPFAQLIQKVLDDLADTQNPDALAFGFPSERAMRLGEHLGLFTPIDQICQLTFDPLPDRRFAERLVPVAELDAKSGEMISHLWQEMAEVLGQDLIGVRDANYLEWRYFRHPRFRYACHFVKSWWGGRPLGAIVTRSDGGQCELMEMIAAPSNMPRLLLAARRLAAHSGGTALQIWLTERHAAHFAEQARSNERLELKIMANPFSSGGNPRRFAGRWWLTSGDTDYH